MPTLVPADRARLAEVHRKRANLIVMIAAILSVVVPFLFWHGTWFGRPLSDREIGQYLADQKNPRHIQHALVQIGERIERGDVGVRRWYPNVVSLARNPVPEIRVTLAWLMGTDNHSDEFRRTLLGMLEDREPLVRRNAALSLVRFGDASGRLELLDMLRPYSVRSPTDGIVHYVLKEGDTVDTGGVLARLETGDREPLEIRSPLPGRLETQVAREGKRVSRGEEILVLSPGEEHVWEALRALYLVGEPGDLPDVERFAAGSVPGMKAKIQQQAVLTAAAIHSRASIIGQGTGKLPAPN